jgi:hypothetical protein
MVPRLRDIVQKQLERFEKLCWRRMEKIRWTSHVKNSVLYRVKEEKNVPRTLTRRKADWIGFILRKNGLTERKIGGRIEVTVRYA